ncbi:hypothetical protein POM88_053403 [Heracleum sosnowskyi]|uniref:non-specific serine/threonine protein kinase n=1 Tax=Heracleum sosnowskyi TaxID=360622 RepID=A0AAD8GQ63_9APIA|nr:hypothetical protein POM88_053403 [Heracleum sosnowskyi]
MSKSLLLLTFISSRLWFDELIDIRQIPNGDGQDIYIRMASSELEDFAKVAEYFDSAVKLALKIKSEAKVAKATNYFSLHNKLGEGGFGPVYKGLLGDGKEIAVKRLSKNSRQGIKEFKNEVVKLVGCCIQEEEKMLIYEYLPNRGLDFFIFDETRSKSFGWPTRFNILNGIARGLLYLRQDSRLRVIHRDLKMGIWLK